MIKLQPWFERKLTFDPPLERFPTILERIRGTSVRAADPGGSGWSLPEDSRAGNAQHGGMDGYPCILPSVLEAKAFTSILIVVKKMAKVRYVHWQEEDYHIGYFEDFPDYMTQGKTHDELLDNLKDLYADISSGALGAFLPDTAENTAGTQIRD